MTFKKLIESNTWSQVSPIFLNLYPDAKDDLSGYESVFKKLESIVAEKTDISIVIYKEKDDDEEYLDVSGLHNNPKNKEDEYPQGIELVPWHKWLGMDISRETLENYSALEIIAHCLYEMTFAGFSEEDIPRALRSIEKSTKEREIMTEEERDANTASVEEILNDWKNKQ